MTDTLSEFDRHYMRILGDVIRRHRKRKGWTRKELRCALLALPRGAVDISLQTLATYELGTRQCSAVRLSQLAAALGTRAGVITGETDERVFAADDRFIVDLVRLAASPLDYLVRPARWAQLQLDTVKLSDPYPVHELTVSALEQLANLCALDLRDMVGALSEYRVH